MPEIENRDLAEPDVIYPCQSGQIVVRPENGTVELRFVTLVGALIAIQLTGSVFEQIHRKSDSTLGEMPEIASWRGELPQ